MPKDNRVVWHWHQLRHTFACRYLERGGSLAALQRMLGHSTSRMTERYAGLSDEALFADLERVERRTAGARQDRPRRNRAAHVAAAHEVASGRYSRRASGRTRGPWRAKRQRNWSQTWSHPCSGKHKSARDRLLGGCDNSCKTVIHRFESGWRLQHSQAIEEVSRQESTKRPSGLGPAGARAAFTRDVASHTRPWARAAPFFFEPQSIGALMRPSGWWAKSPILGLAGVPGIGCGSWFGNRCQRTGFGLVQDPITGAASLITSSVIRCPSRE